MSLKKGTDRLVITISLIWFIFWIYVAFSNGVLENTSIAVAISMLPIIFWWIYRGYTSKG